MYVLVQILRIKARQQGIISSIVVVDIHDLAWFE